MEGISWGLLGCLVGTITGMIPGLHNNTIAVWALTASVLPPQDMMFFVLGMAIMHSMAEFVPAIFLGTPGEDSFLSLLPGQQMLREGRGEEAVYLTVAGGMGSGIMALLLMPGMMVGISRTYGWVEQWMGWLLLFAFLLLLLVAPQGRRMQNALIMGLASTIGIVVLSMGVVYGSRYSRWCLVFLLHPHWQ